VVVQMDESTVPMIAEHKGAMTVGLLAVREQHKMEELAEQPADLLVEERRVVEEWQKYSALI
jgi:hypothetical protein